MAGLAELADAVVATQGVSGDLLVFDPLDPGAAVVIAAARAAERPLRVLRADPAVREAILVLLGELAPEGAAVEFEATDLPDISAIPGPVAPVVAFAHLGGDARHTAEALVALAPRLAPGARLTVGRAAEDPEVATAVEAFLDSHAGLLRRPGTLLHLVPEPG